MLNLLHPTYFPNIATFSLIVKDEVAWEVHDNFQKQTYRNRCHIATDQGRKMLNIPIRHIGGEQGRQLYKNVKVDYSMSWQKQHWKTLQTAYRTSPFFEYYEDEFVPFFNSRFEGLMDLNLASTELLCNCFGISIPNMKSSLYEKEPTAHNDFRFLVNAKKSFALQQEPYFQVFGERHGFLENLSALDLLFNKGPESLAYLKQIAIDLNNA